MTDLSLERAICVDALPTGVNVLVLDDEPGVASRLRKLLAETKPGLHVGGVAQSIPDARHRIEEQRPDALVTELILGDQSSLPLVRWSSTACPDMLIVIYSRCPAEVYCPRAFKAGASGYVSKSENPDVLREALRAASDGAFMSRVVAGRLARAQRDARQYIPPTFTLARLSDHELHVFDLVGREYSPDHIAAASGSTSRAVDRDMRRIRTKLGLPSAREFRACAARWVASYQVDPSRAEGVLTE